ncbi:MAG: carboxypeptidase-like regulatory domain-containing protein [Candidatus Acidiferrales bacterium]
MKLKAWTLLHSMTILALLLLSSNQMRAQALGVTLTGRITDASGHGVPNAKISAKNAASGQSTDAQSDSNGVYKVPDLMPGDYEVSASAEGFTAQVSKITLAAEAQHTLDVTLSSGPSLSDLGFPPAETQGSAQDQARLNKRSHMLKIHQELGLIDVGPLLATVILGAGSGGKSTSSANRYAHLALGSVTGDLYFMSAYYAIRAPKIPGTEVRGPIRLHKALAWIHGPGMILTPILGAMAFDQKSKGERVHGIASAHGAVAIVTAAAYGAAILSVSFKF